MDTHSAEGEKQFRNFAFCEPNMEALRNQAEADDAASRERFLCEVESERKNFLSNVVFALVLLNKISLLTF